MTLYSEGDFKSLLTDSYRSTADDLVCLIGDDKKYFDVLFKMSFKEKYPFNMRTARVCQLACSKYSALINSHVKKLPMMLESSNNDGVKRSYLRVLCDNYSSFDISVLNDLYNLGLNFLSKKGESVAVKALSVDILLKYSKFNKNVINDLMEIASVELYSTSKAMKSKAAKVIDYVKKETLNA